MIQSAVRGVSFIGMTNNAITSTTTSTANYATGANAAQAGDLLVLILANSEAYAYVAPSGWTAITNRVEFNVDIGLYVGWKIANGAETGSVSANYTTTTSTTAGVSVGIIMRYASAQGFPAITLNNNCTYSTSATANVGTACPATVSVSGLASTDLMLHVLAGTNFTSNKDTAGQTNYTLTNPSNWTIRLNQVFNTFGTNYAPGLVICERLGIGTDTTSTTSTVKTAWVTSAQQIICSPTPRPILEQNASPVQMRAQW